MIVGPVLSKAVILLLFIHCLLLLLFGVGVLCIVHRVNDGKQCSVTV